MVKKKDTEIGFVEGLFQFGDNIAILKCLWEFGSLGEEVIDFVLVGLFFQVGIEDFFEVVVVEIFGSGFFVLPEAVGFEEGFFEVLVGVGGVGGFWGYWGL